MLLKKALSTATVLLVDHAPFHTFKGVRNFVRAHYTKIRLYFLPKKCPEFNPDEQVWNEVKVYHIGKYPLKNKHDFNRWPKLLLAELQRNTKRIHSFLVLDYEKYAKHPISL